MTIENKLNDWKDANTFDDLCNLMRRSLRGDLESFITNNANSVLAKYMQYEKDFIKLNRLGFLAISAQPGMADIRRVNTSNISAEIQKYVKEKKIDLNDLVELYEQREYIRGFVTKDMLSKLLPKLNEYITFVEPAHGKNSKVEVRKNYEHEIEQNVAYIYAPEYYEKQRRDLCLAPYVEPIIDINKYKINVSRFTYDFKKDIAVKYRQIRKPAKYKGNETDEEKLLNSCFNLILEDYGFIKYLINYDINLMYLSTNMHLENRYDFDKNYFRSFKPELAEWMEQNTYLITIIRPEYTFNLTGLLLSLLSTEDKLEDWENANTFNDLCTLMQLSLKEDYESFTSYLSDRTNSVLVEESIPFRDNFIKLNQLGFLTVDSQPGTTKIKQINNITDVVNEINASKKPIIKYINEKGLKSNDLIELYQQREYIEGFMTKEKLSKILPKLNNYIVCVNPSGGKQSKIKVRNNYEHTLKQNFTYIYLPNHFDTKWPESSYFCAFNPILCLDYYLINVSRYTYDFKNDVVAKYQQNRKSIDNKDGDEIDKEKLINSCFNLMLEDYSFIEKFINYDYNLMYLPTNTHFEDQQDFNKEYYFKHFTPELTKWMDQNTYLVTIISPQYGTNYLMGDLLKLL